MEQQDLVLIIYNQKIHLNHFINLVKILSQIIQVKYPIINKEIQDLRKNKEIEDLKVKV